MLLTQRSKAPKHSRQQLKSGQEKPSQGKREEPAERVDDRRNDAQEQKLHIDKPSGAPKPLTEAPIVAAAAAAAAAATAAAAAAAVASGLLRFPDRARRSEGEGFHAVLFGEPERVLEASDVPHGVEQP